MALPNGFRSTANRIAEDVRAGVGVHLCARLDPRLVAAQRGCALIALSALRQAAPEAVDHFSTGGRQRFSAFTLVAGEARAIVYNDSNSPARQTSDIAHELAHDLLGHPPGSAVDPIGCRRWDEDAEDEADWLSATLLVPDEAAIHVARSGLPIAAAAWRFGVSVRLMRWRLNVTGARRRARTVERGPSGTLWNRPILLPRPRSA